MRYFDERLRALRKLRQQLVAVVVEVPHQRHVEAHAVELLTDGRDFRRRLGRVHGDANDLGARLRELLHLHGGGDRVGRVRVGHRLHDHWSFSADQAPPGGPSAPRPGARRAAASAGPPRARSQWARRAGSRALLDGEARDVRACHGLQVERLAPDLHGRLRRVANDDGKAAAFQTGWIASPAPAVCDTTILPLASVTSTHDDPLKDSSEERTRLVQRLGRRGRRLDGRRRLAITARARAIRAGHLGAAAGAAG